MKNLFLWSVFMIAVVSCKNKNSTLPETPGAIAMKMPSKINPTAVPVMSFTESKYDFGTISEGDVVSHEFSFTNTGTVPLIIVNAKGSCGCTVPEWPKEAIVPGASGRLLVTFNSKGKPNLQSKKITITANTESGKETLTIKALVTPKA